MEERKRSILKAISWRVTGTIDTFFVSLIITGKPMLALSIGLFEVLTKTVLYYFHERTWNKLKYGRKPKEDFVI